MGGGVLKLEPGEAARIVFPPPDLPAASSNGKIEAALSTMRAWRHCGDGR